MDDSTACLMRTNPSCEIRHKEQRPRRITYPFSLSENPGSPYPNPVPLDMSMSSQLPPELSGLVTGIVPRDQKDSLLETKIDPSLKKYGPYLKTLLYSYLWEHKSEKQSNRLFFIFHNNVQDKYF